MSKKTLELSKKKTLELSKNPIMKGGERMRPVNQSYRELCGINDIDTELNTPSWILTMY